MNVPSGRIGHKDVVKVESRELSEDELDVLALIAPDEHAALRRVADAAVTELDDFRASPDAAELERRRVGCLTDRQEALLNRWGYPYVMEEFRFHLTLTGPVRDPDAVEEVLQMVLADRLETPLALDALSLCGEGEDGFFREVARFPLRG